MPTALITGVSGQDGGYLAEALLADGYQVHGLVRRPDPELAALQARSPSVVVHYGDLSDGESLRALVREVEPDEIYNLGGVSSVAFSWEHPLLTAEITGLGAAALLDAAWLEQVRSGRAVRFLQASSAEIFGAAERSPQNEATPIRPITPYGAAKAFAHHLVGVYRARGLHASSCILYNHESPRRPDTFVTRKITKAAALIAAGEQEVLSLGNLDARRDWGWAPDYVAAMRLAVGRDVASDYVIATGQARSVGDFVEAAFRHAGVSDWRRHVEVDPQLARPADAHEQIGDAAWARRALGWGLTVSFEDMVARMVDVDRVTPSESTSPADPGAEPVSAPTDIANSEVKSQPAPPWPAWVDRWGDRARSVVVGIPDRLALLLFWSAATVTAMLQFKIFNPYAAIVVSAVLFVATWRIRPTRYGTDQRSLLGAVVAIQVVLAWIWINAPYYEQMLSVYRDPSIYALRGWWLTKHSSPVITISKALQGAHGVPGVVVAAGGFPVHGGVEYPQGASLVPGLIAVAGRVGGLRAMLDANLLIAGVGLLIVYGLARRIMGPLWALVPMVALALSMPMVYFVRASYTEPTALAAVFGGLLLLVSAFQSKRAPLYLVAGALVGVSALARVDGVLAVAGTMLGIGIAVVGAVDPARQRELRRGFVAFSVGGAAASVVGWYDLKYNSPSYYHSQAADLHKLFALLALVFVAVLVFSYLPLARLRRWLTGHRRGIGRSAVVFVLVVCAAMASRPLWWVGRFNSSPIGQVALAQRQRGAGLKVDPTRSYDENTVTWLAWYLSWPVVILAAVGLALILYRVVRRRDLTLLALFATLGVVSALYLNDVSITPDQIWASRRLLPVIIPGMLIAASFVVASLSRQMRLRWLAGSLAVLVAIGPALSWRYVFMQPEFGGELKAVDAACSAVDQGAHGAAKYVVFVGSVPATGSWSPTLQIICGATVVSVPRATPATLAVIRANWGNPPVTVVTFTAADLQWVGTTPAPRFTGAATLWAQSLVARPAATSNVDITFWTGTVGPDGQVTPLTP